MERGERCWKEAGNTVDILSLCQLKMTTLGFVVHSVQAVYLRSFTETLANQFERDRRTVALMREQ